MSENFFSVPDFLALTPAYSALGAFPLCSAPRLPFVAVSLLFFLKLFCLVPCRFPFFPASASLSPVSLLLSSFPLLYTAISRPCGFGRGRPSVGGAKKKPVSCGDRLALCVGWSRDDRDRTDDLCNVTAAL